MRITTHSERPTVFAKLRPRVLVVDDDAAILRMLERMLRRLGCTAVLASGTAAALELAAAGPRLSLGIVDLRLGDGDGARLIEQLTEHLGDEAPPFIIFSGRGRPDRLPAGVVATVLKPAAITELSETVKTAIVDSGARVRARTAQRAVSSTDLRLYAATAKRLRATSERAVHRFGCGPVAEEVVPSGVLDPRWEP